MKNININNYKFCNQCDICNRILIVFLRWPESKTKINKHLQKTSMLLLILFNDVPKSLFLCVDILKGSNHGCNMPTPTQWAPLLPRTRSSCHRFLAQTVVRGRLTVCQANIATKSCWASHHTNNISAT